MIRKGPVVYNDDGAEVARWIYGAWYRRIQVDEHIEYEHCGPDEARKYNEIPWIKIPKGGRRG